MKRRKLVSALSAAGILAAGAAALLLLTSFKAEAAVVEQPVEVRTVSTAMLVPGAQSTVIRSDGFLESARSVEIVSPIAGKVQQSAGSLKSGVTVEEGEILVQLDDRRAGLGFEISRSEMINASSRFMTAAGLDESSRQAWSGYLADLAVSSPESLPAMPELDGRETLLAATMGVSAAHSGLIAASLDLQDHRIAAPFGGSLSGEGIATGSYVAPGAPLAVLYETASLELPLALPMDRAAGIGPGTPVVLTADNGDKTEARVLRVEPALTAGNQMIRAYAGLSVEETGIWLPGSFVTADISGPVYENACRVSRKYLVDDRLPVFEDGRLLLRGVEVLARDGEDIIFSADSDEAIEVVLTVLQNPVEGLPLQRETE